MSITMTNLDKDDNQVPRFDQDVIEVIEQMPAMTMKWDWLQFSSLVDLHKFYFGILITSASFYLGIVGALLAYVARAHMPPARFRLSLSIPVLLSISACLGYGAGYFKLCDLETWILQCKASLKLGWAPHAEVLPRLSLLLSVVAGLVTIGLVVMLLWPDVLLPAPEAL
jgi:hypothetical protein